MTFNPREHFTDIKGRDYLDVKWRIVWMRDEHPNWGIHTDLISGIEGLVTFKATVTDENGMVIATGHGTAKDTTGKVWSGRHVEKAETAAIGRALAHAGYGTQFTEEDEEGDIVDSPVERKPATPPKPPVDAPASPPVGAAPTQVTSTVEPLKAAENGQSAPNPLFDTLPAQTGDLFPDDFSHYVPQWNELKAQRLSEYKAERAFYLILGKLQLFSNTWERDNSIKKHLPNLKETTLAEAIYIMRHRKEEKYGSAPNETDLNKKTGKTDDIAASMEKAKLEKTG